MSGREPAMDALMALLAASIDSTFTGTAAYGSAVITGIASTAGLFAGLPATSSRTPPTATIASVDSATQITLSEAATAAGTVTFTTGFRTTSRRLKLWDQVSAQPALFIRNSGDEIAQRPMGMPSKVTLECEAWIYNKSAPREEAAPAVVQNYLIDAITSALEPATGYERQTLGGLVYACWIEGRIERHPGDLDDQAIAIIPIRILMPDPLN